MEAGTRRLQGRCAIITGGAAGAGAATARRFAAEGARVAVFDLQQELGQSLVAEIGEEGGEAIFCLVDVASDSDVRQAVQATLGAYGGIDILFNHAGTVVVERLVDMSERAWDRLMAVNVKGMFLTCRAVLPTMIAAGSGVVLNTSSISGVTASPYESAYCASKGAILQLTRAIAVEYRDEGIRCNAICPGFIRTEHGLREIDDLNARGVDVSEATIASFQARMCEPNEVASAALALVSDDMAFVNGAALFVDNGWTALT